jgi:cytochrome c
MLGRICALILILVSLPAQAQLRGHGGPVRALAVHGATAMSGSFDQSAIVWDLERGAALQVLRFHDGAVNALAALPDGRFLSGGEDGRIVVWRVGETTPAQVIEAHKAPVAGLAVLPDGDLVASASWDGTVRVTDLKDGRARVLQGHQGNVNAVAFLPDGRVVSAGYDATLRLWPKDSGPPVIVTLPTPLNVLAAAPDGEIVVAGADGVVRILNSRQEVRAAIETTGSPIIGLALSHDGSRIAAAAIAGSVALIDRAQGRVLFNLVGPGLPVWSVAFRPGGGELLTGGSDRLVRRWDMSNGEHIGPVAMARPDDELAAFKGERGAEVFQACAACHTLTPDGGNRAGPTLHGVFGRRIATAPGYNYSEALTKLDIVWGAETIAKLFEVGPARYTPGTKMPEQHITSAADREALVRFLEKATNGSGPGSKDRVPQ